MSGAGLDGLRVLSFESRLADEMRRMLEKAGAEVHVSPSMQEVPLGADSQADRFIRTLLDGGYDVVVLLTGVALRQVLARLEGVGASREDFVAALGKTVTVCRGPKPVVVLRELGLQPGFQAPSPNTWKELLATLREKSPVAGKRVAVLEYGKSREELLTALRDDRAEVDPIRLYGWSLPDDLAPLEANVARVADGQADLLLFTSSPQVVHFWEIAERLGLRDQVRLSLKCMVIGSVGPTTTETLHDFDLTPDFEPVHPKMGHLIQAAVEQAAGLVEKKRKFPTQIWFLPQESAAPHVAGGEESLEEPAWVATAPQETIDSLFMKACRGEPVPRLPIWLMRQAGRYLPEYREIREKVTFLELCKNPELCAEVMVRTVERLGVDAAIIFSDLLPILEPLGFLLEFVKDEGPKIHNPIREAADVDRVLPLEDMQPLLFVAETVRLTRESLPAHIPVIGFAGAPFTLASYAIEGGSSRNFQHVKSFMYNDPGAWHHLMTVLADSVTLYLNAQIAAGAQAVQLFDSWAGCLSPDDFRQYVLPYTKKVLDGIPDSVPTINFATGNPALLPLMAQAGGTVIGIDWRVRLDDARRLVGPGRSIQGNLDPTVLFASKDEITRQVREVIRQAGPQPGHIFNLGHGVLPGTPVDNVLHLIETVQGISLPLQD